VSARFERVNENLEAGRMPRQLHTSHRHHTLTPVCVRKRNERNLSASDYYL